MGDFSGCLDTNGRNLSESNIMGSHIAGEAAGSGSGTSDAGFSRAKGCWVWALLVSGVVGFASLL